MCTVIYIPTKDGELMCSVRDENPNRKRASLPARQLSGNHDFWSPIDGEAGGTWWAVNELGHTIILLNGAFENHLPNRCSYRKSRGLIVKELAEQTDLIAEWKRMGLSDIEPFTLVIKQNQELFDCRWDGSIKHTTPLSISEAHIWSSATLYTQKAQQYRNQLFLDFLKKSPSTTSDIKDFLAGYQESENGFLMHRFENLCSLSISIFHFQDSTVELDYNDLISNETNVQTIQLLHS